MKDFMKVAYKEALKAYKKNEIPVGAVIIKNNRLIAKSHNNRQKKHFLLGHAEINCMLKAEKKLKDWRLDGCELYVTLKPCDMCEMLIKEARVDKVVYMVDKNGVKSERYKEKELSDDYSKKIKEFFKKMRN